MSDPTPRDSGAVGRQGPPWPLSVAIITLNEEANLPRCLASVRGLAREIVVVDSGSSDRTVAIAEAAGARCVVHPWAGNDAQKNVAFGLCREPWVLGLDADEEVSPELASSIGRLFAAGEPDRRAYEVSRLTWYLGDWIHHVWYPGWRLRLARREGAVWRGGPVHDRLEVEGPVGRLDGDLLHYTYRDFSHHLSQVVRYASLGADALAARGVGFRLWHFLLGPPAGVFRQLVVRQGWRDGYRGWLIAGATAFGVYAKEGFLLERRLVAREATRRRELTGDRTADPPPRV